jgi:hypothetical protein
MPDLDRPRVGDEVGGTEREIDDCLDGGERMFVGFPRCCGNEEYLSIWS